jgi:hypothetical protein
MTIDKIAIQNSNTKLLSFSHLRPQNSHTGIGITVGVNAQ